MKYRTSWIVVLIVTAACGGPPFESPLFVDAGAGGDAWTGTASGSGSGSATSSTGGSSGSGHGGAGGNSTAHSTGSGLSGSGSAQTTGTGGGASNASVSSATSGSGGSGGADPPCGPATCAGCCDDVGTCQIGASDAACGEGGGVCDVCKSQCGWDPPGAPYCSIGEGTGEAWFGCQEHACAPKLGQWADMTWHDGICCAAPCDAQTGKCP